MQATHRKVLLFEMNEVPYRVLDDFVRRHPQSSLSAIMARAKQFETVCEDQLELDPWSSWPTLHRGVIDEQHGVRHLGQSLEWADRQYPPIWQLVARGGRSVGVFGSLHSSRVPEPLDGYAFYVPDFFADQSFAHPAELQAFQAFNLVMTRRSARNVDARIPPGAALAFLRAYARQGINWSTAGRVMRALAAELLSAHRRSRRRSLQPLIAMDVFAPLLRRTRPDFATFYTNHVAASMHRFWAAAFPHDVAENPMPVEWRRKYARDIDYAMGALDELFARLRALADELDYVLVVASSIGQAACRGESALGFTTITDLERFMARMGLGRREFAVLPAMVPCISVRVDAARAEGFEQRLNSLTVGKYRVHRATREGSAPFTYDRSGDASFHLWVYFPEL